MIGIIGIIISALMSIWIARHLLRVRRLWKEYEPISEERTQVFKKAMETSEMKAFDILHARHGELVELSREKLEELHRVKLWP